MIQPTDVDQLGRTTVSTRPSLSTTTGYFTLLVRKGRNVPVSVLPQTPEPWSDDSTLCTTSDEENVPQYKKRPKVDTRRRDLRASPSNRLPTADPLELVTHYG